LIDKNGREIKTGDAVVITGAYFKNDNATYFVTHSPGDVTWTGKNYSLIKMSKTGKISKSKNKYGSWPIGIYTNDRKKQEEGTKWNKEHAQIEIVNININERVEYFNKEMQDYIDFIKNNIHRFGADSDVIKQQKDMAEHCQHVIDYLEAGE